MQYPPTFDTNQSSLKYTQYGITGVGLVGAAIFMMPTSIFNLVITSQELKYLTFHSV